MQTVSRRTGEPAKRYKNAMRLLLQNETAFREGWYQKDFSRLNFGTGLCRMHKRNSPK